MLLVSWSLLLPNSLQRIRPGCAHPSLAVHYVRRCVGRSSWRIHRLPRRLVIQIQLHRLLKVPLRSPRAAEGEFSLPALELTLFEMVARAWRDSDSEQTQCLAQALRDGRHDRREQVGTIEQHFAEVCAAEA